MNTNQVLKSALQALESVVIEYNDINIKPPLQVIHAIDDCKKALRIKNDYQS
jgi:hypothetical protein